MLETDAGLHDESFRSQHDTLKDPEDIFHKAALESVAYNHQVRLDVITYFRSNEFTKNRLKRKGNFAKFSDSGSGLKNWKR